MVSWLRRRSETQFRGPPVQPTEDLNNDDINRLIGIASAKSTDTVMRNHFYTINGEIRRQSDGSPIGLDISVEITGLYM